MKEREIQIFGTKPKKIQILKKIWFSKKFRFRQDGELWRKVVFAMERIQRECHSAFGDLREDKEFTDVTLACEDGQQVEAHKVVLIASSPCLVFR